MVVCEKQESEQLEMAGWELPGVMGEGQWCRRLMTGNDHLSWAGHQSGYVLGSYEKEAKKRSKRRTLVDISGQSPAHSDSFVLAQKVCSLRLFINSDSVIPSRNVFFLPFDGEQGVRNANHC